MKSFYVLLGLLMTSIILVYSIGCFYAYFYPMKYYEEIVDVSQKYDIDGALVASIANVESNFKNDAKSNKGAIGIMQIMPSTAEWIASKLNKEYAEEMLYEPSYNIELGAYYLSYLIDSFEDEKLVICAYNAGQGNVSNWLANKEYSSDGKSLNKIPFKETKNYLNKVTKNYRYYKNKYK